MICIYHSADLDGMCSAAIAYRRFAPEADVVFLPLDYGHDVPWDLIAQHPVVYMVDFSLPLADMQRLNAMCELHWIDHHTQKIAEAEAAGFRASGGQLLAHDDPAACELTWEYVLPHERVPWAVQLLGRYDAWDHREETVLPFQYGMRAQANMRPQSSRWRLLLGDRNPTYIRGIVEQGRAILRYVAQEHAKLVEGALFVSELAGHRALCVNRLYVNSTVFDSVPADVIESAELLVNFGYDGKPAWRVGLSPVRDGELDVSQIAAQFGGGGHAGRAGFHCTQLPFALPPQRENRDE